MVVIGLTPVRDEEKKRICMPNDYIKAVLRANALPVVFPLTAGHHACDNMLEIVDGIIFTGGGDISPQIYNESTLPFCGKIDPDRDEQEQYLMGCAIFTKKPLLAICRGMQLLACVTGGTLYQDIGGQYSTEIKHERMDIPRDYAHTVDIIEGTLLASCVQNLRTSVNSRHHQGVKTLGPDMIASAKSPDGLVEAIEFSKPLPVIGVQWHPESLSDRFKEAHALFSWLVDCAGKRSCDMLKNENSI